MPKNQSNKRIKSPIKMWTYQEAMKAMPYVRSIVGELRNQSIEARRLGLELTRIKDRAGRPSRADLIRLGELERECAQAQDRLQEGMEELHTLGVACTDVLKGLAVFPFVYDDQIAWFTYDYFEGPYLRWWRFDSDQPQTRRPIYSDMKDDPKLAVRS